MSKPSSAPPSASAPSADATKSRSAKKKSSFEVPERPGVARIVAIANQKGGVGKSTTAVSLGAALADLGFRVLVVDLDPQGNASTGMGIKHEHRETTTYDVIVAEASVADAIVHSPIKGLDAVPSTIDLAGAEIELVSQFSREARLKRALEPVREGVYDFVFLDCPPSLGLITINALTAAEELIVPIQCEYYALEGLGQLLRNVSLVQQNINPELRLTGIVMTMFDPRTKLSEQVVAEVQRFFGELVYDSIIPRTVRLSEAPGFGVPITVYDPKSKGADAYRALAREVASRPPPTSPMPSFDEMPAMVVPTLSREPLTEEDPEEAEPEAEPDRVELASVAELEAPTPATEAVATPPVVEAAADPPPVTVEAPLAPSARSELPDDEIWEEPESDRARVRPAQGVAPGELPERRVVVIDEDADVPAGGVGRRVADGPDGSAVGATLNDEDRHRRRWRLFRKGGE